MLTKHDVKISMDGKGASCRRRASPRRVVNVVVERLWRSVKHEEVYLRAYDTVSEARERLGKYLDWYNRRRPHSSLDGRTADEAYFSNMSMPPIRLAA